MAEEPEITAQQPAAEKKSSKKIIFIAAGAVVVIVGVVAVLFLTGVIGGGGGTEDGSDPAQAVKPLSPDQVKPTVSLETFVVNLADAEVTRFLKISLVIELADGSLSDQVEARKSKIRDAIITLLSSQTFAQIRDSKGKLKLKQDLTLRLNEVLGTNAVSDVLFTEFIIS